MSVISVLREYNKISKHFNPDDTSPLEMLKFRYWCVKHNKEAEGYSDRRSLEIFVDDFADKIEKEITVLCCYIKEKEFEFTLDYDISDCYNWIIKTYKLLKR